MTLTSISDKVIALFFFILTIVFIAICMTNKVFFDWVFERHLNQWSWYLRPLFLIPFCYFAHKHCWSGISITVFCLFTSMFWFPKPEVVSKNAEIFLEFEKDYLYGEWNLSKLLMTLTIPVSFIALGLAFWKRSLIMGLGVIMLIATGKILWSIQTAGESGKSIIFPAIVGLLICIGILSYGFKKFKQQ